MRQQAGPILVTGATGNSGLAVVDALIGRGAAVRAMARTEADRGKLPAGVDVVLPTSTKRRLSQRRSTGPNGRTS